MSIILSRFLAVISLILVVFCMMSPMRRRRHAVNCPFFNTVVRYHTLWAWLLVPISLIHGILVVKSPGAISGKLTWVVLVLLTVFSLFQKKMKHRSFIMLHRALSILFCVMIAAHIVLAVYGTYFA